MVSQKFIVIVENHSDIQAVRGIVQDLKLQGDITVEVGDVPSIETPTGVQKGDKAMGGTPIGRCTIGYAINYQANGVSKQGIVTAGHCSKPLAITSGGRTITFGSAILYYPNKVSNGVSDKYDYQILDATGLTLSNNIH